MTTARTHITQVSARSLGTPSARVPEPKADDFVPVSAETFATDDTETTTDDTEPAEAYDPAEHNIPDIKAHVQAHPDQAADILEAELNGMERSTLIEWLEDFDPDTTGE